MLWPDGSPRVRVLTALPPALHHTPAGPQAALLPRVGTSRRAVTSREVAELALGSVSA